MSFIKYIANESHYKEVLSLEMLNAAIEQFDNVWMGKFCKDCGKSMYCADPIK